MTKPTPTKQVPDTGRRKPPAAGKGRPKGAVNKTTRDSREMATKLVTDAVYVANLQMRLREGKAPHMETLLHHYAYGKPKETLDGTVTHLHKVYAWQD